MNQKTKAKTTMKIKICILCKNYYCDVIVYACVGAFIIGILTAISLFPVTVGVWRGQENQNPPTFFVTQASYSTINEELDERTLLVA